MIYWCIYYITTNYEHLIYFWYKSRKLGSLKIFANCERWELDMFHVEYLINIINTEKL